MPWLEYRIAIFPHQGKEAGKHEKDIGALVHQEETRFDIAMDKRQYGNKEVGKGDFLVLLADKKAKDHVGDIKRKQEGAYGTDKAKLEIGLKEAVVARDDGIFPTDGNLELMIEIEEGELPIAEKLEEAVVHHCQCRFPMFHAHVDGYEIRHVFQESVEEHVDGMAFRTGEGIDEESQKRHIDRDEEERGNPVRAEGNEGEEDAIGDDAGGAEIDGGPATAEKGVEETEENDKREDGIGFPGKEDEAGKAGQGHQKAIGILMSREAFQGPHAITFLFEEGIEIVDDNVPFHDHGIGKGKKGDDDETEKGNVDENRELLSEGIGVSEKKDEIETEAEILDQGNDAGCHRVVVGNGCRHPIDVGSEREIRFSFWKEQGPGKAAEKEDGEKDKDKVSFLRPFKIGSPSPNEEEGKKKEDDNNGDDDGKVRRLEGIDSERKVRILGFDELSDAEKRKHKGKNGKDETVEDFPVLTFASVFENDHLLFGSLVLEDLQYRPEKDLGVEPQGTVLDIVKLHVDSLRVVDIASSVACPIGGDARSYGKKDLACQTILVCLDIDDGPRPDDGHVSKEDVQNLGKLVQGRLSQEFADLGDTGIVVDLELGVELLELFWCQLLLNRSLVVLHRAELVHVERLAILADATMAIKDRSLGRAFDENGENQVEPAEDKEEKPRDENVQETLDEGINGLFSEIICAIDGGLDFLDLQRVLAKVMGRIRFVCHFLMLLCCPDRCR